MKLPSLILLSTIVLAGCEPRVLTPEEAAQQCEQRARAAQGPTGAVTLGVNSNSGPYSAVSVGVTGDYLAGRDPVQIYRDCVVRRTGQEPYRAPVLR